MNELRKFLAPEIIFGRGAIDVVSQYVENLGAFNPLVVTDQDVLSAGWSGCVVLSLKKAGISSVVYKGISPNPRDDEVMRGVDVFNNSECDAVIAVGGGSVLDCAKGIAVCSVTGENILSFEGVDKISSPGPPLICIPTTAGSSADVSQFAIINDVKAGVKRSIISKAVVPDVALIDPQTTHTMGSYLTACTGMDVLVHAIEAYVSTAHSPLFDIHALEAYVSTAHSPLFDIHALEAVRLVFSSLPEVLKSPDNPSLRDDLMRASLEAGLAFSNASLGAVHAMAHSLGGYLDLPHGECNAILLDHVIAFNAAEAESRYAEIAAAAGCREESASALTLIEMVKKLKREIGITSRLDDYGISEQNIAGLSKNALNDACMVTNPRVPSLEDIENIYRQAF